MAAGEQAALNPPFFFLAMKQLFLLACALVFGLNQAYASVPQIRVAADDGPKIGLEFTIGRASRDCAGFSVCKVKVTVGWELRVANGGAGYGQVGADGRLQLEVLKSTMTDETNARYFTGGSFLVEEAYTLDPDVAQQLQVSSYTIKTGSYPVRDMGDRYLIVF
jgi:hypothetical protein